MIADRRVNPRLRALEALGEQLTEELAIVEQQQRNGIPLTAEQQVWVADHRRQMQRVAAAIEAAR